MRSGIVRSVEEKSELKHLTFMRRGQKAEVNNSYTRTAVLLIVSHREKILANIGVVVPRQVNKENTSRLETGNEQFAYPDSSLSNHLS